MSVATVTTAPSGPLNESQQEEIAAAYLRGKKVRKAAGVAAFNGWVTGFFAIVSAPFAIFSLSGLLVTIGLAVVAYNEFRGRRGLLGFDASATSMLGWNQIGFLGLILMYCLWMLFTGLSGEGPFAAELREKPELASAFTSVEGFDQLYRLLLAAVYGTVMVLSIVFQGLNSLYYFTRRKHVESYLRQTPEWVLQLQRLSPGQ